MTSAHATLDNQDVRMKKKSPNREEKPQKNFWANLFRRILLKKLQKISEGQLILLEGEKRQIFWNSRDSRWHHG